jgi:hypothetical protein
MNDNMIECIEYKNYRIEIYHDDSEPESPRYESNIMSKMVCFHNRYALGDEHKYSVKQAKKIANSKKYIVLPVYLYDHSGLTINTTGFPCPWDSGHVGWIWAKREEIRSKLGWKAISKKRKNKIETILNAEIELYDRWIGAEMYGYCIYDQDGVMLGSCWGFYDMDEMVVEAKSDIDYSSVKEQKSGQKTDY